MANMKKFNDQEIDDIVISQADDDSAWEKPISIKVDKTLTVSLSRELTARAIFLARLHQNISVEQWIEAIITERIAFEEKAFTTLKQHLSHS